jgi:hypothetical protein
MKKFAVLFILALVIFASCSRPYYKSKEGKRKQKYYNDIQFGRDPHPKMKF